MVRFLLLSLLVTVAMPAWAQNTLPAFNMRNLSDDNIQRLPPPESVQAIDEYEFFKENDYLRDLIKLQYQNYVLERLLERQTEIERVAEAYANLDLTYNRPAPPLGLCRQLPANLLCVSYFPSLYQDTMQGVKEQVKKEVESLVALIQQADSETKNFIQSAKDKEAKVKKTTDTKAEKSASVDYRWSDITCLAGECEAVIEDLKTASFNQTVKIGDALPDGSMVAMIAASGVKIKDKGAEAKPMSLKPMPIGGAETVPTDENPFGLPGLVNLDSIDLPPGVDFTMPNIPPVAVSADSLSEMTGQAVEPQPIEVQSTDADGAIVEAVNETEGLSEAQPVLPATGLTF